MTRQEFFDMKAAGALWDVGVSINRTNPLPIDKTEVFASYDEALTYAKGVLSYPGQFIAVVAEDGSVTGYIITVAGGAGATMQKLAAQTSTGDVVADLAALTTRVGNLETSVDGIKTEIGVKKDGETTAASGIYKYVDDAVAAATPEGYSGVKADVTKLVGADKGEDGRANKTVREIASEEVAKIVNGAPEAYDTLKEVSDWISTHGTDAATMNTKIGENTAAIQTLNGTAETVGSVANTVNTAIDGALKADGKDKYALATDLTTANGKITALETKTAGLTDAEGADMTVKAYVDAKETTLSTAISTAKSGAESTAKSYTDTEIGKLSNDDKAVDNQFVTVVKETNGVVAVTRRGLTAADIPALEMGKISNLETALDAKQDTVSFNTEYNSATNKAATIADVDAAKTALVGKAEDLAGVDTIKGAKKYADEKSATALSDAKAYADGLVTGDSGITKRVETLEGKHATGKTVAEEVTAGIDALNLAGTYAPKTHTHAVAEVTGLSDELSNYALAGQTNDAIEAVSNKIGEVPSDSASVVDYVQRLDTAAMEARAGILDKVDTLIDKDAGKSARTIANEELAKQLIAEGADAKYDTLQEIAAWIQQHPKDAAEMNSKITALEGKAHEHANKKVIDGITAEKVTSWDSALHASDIKVATEAVAGVVKASEEIAVATDGKMSLQKVSTDLLFNGTNELILNGGEI